jgi:hypothetical protein
MSDLSNRPLITAAGADPLPLWRAHSCVPRRDSSRRLPAATVGVADFARISSTRTDQRQIQLGLRLTF